MKAEQPDSPTPVSLTLGFNAHSQNLPLSSPLLPLVSLILYVVLDMCFRQSIIIPHRGEICKSERETERLEKHLGNVVSCTLISSSGNILCKKEVADLLARG